MTAIARPEVEYYFDSHPTEEDLMGYNELQAKVVRYLMDLLEWLFRAEGWLVAMDLNIYLTANPHEEPLAPDIAVFKGVALPEERDDYLPGWHIDPPEAPAPAIVFEIASPGTWQKDLVQKPTAYARMGVREYVYFDPGPRRPGGSPRMKVWRTEEGTAIELPADERGWVWSEELQSWLAPEGIKLHLHDHNGQMRLTGKERAWAELRKLGVDPETLL